MTGNATSGAAGQQGPRIEMVDPRTAQRWIERDEAVLVDVREAREFAMEHIANAISLPLSAFDPVRVPDSPGKRTLLMCASGVRCGMAAELMARAGYPKIYRLAGGIMAWKAGGGPVVEGR
jgi:rhodanese-related sulfurtransferase